MVRVAGLNLFRFVVRNAAHFLAGWFGVDRALGFRQQRLVNRPVPPVRECLFLVLDFVARQQTDGLSGLVLLPRRQGL
jgi:hypothetical protein